MTTTFWVALLLFWAVIWASLVILYVVLDRVVCLLLRNKMVLVLLVLLFLLGVGLRIKGGF